MGNLQGGLYAGVPKGYRMLAYLSDYSYNKISGSGGVTHLNYLNMYLATLDKKKIGALRF